MISVGQKQKKLTEKTGIVRETLKQAGFVRSELHLQKILTWLGIDVDLEKNTYAITVTRIKTIQKLVENVLVTRFTTVKKLSELVSSTVLATCLFRNLINPKVTYLYSQVRARKIMYT